MNQHKNTVGSSYHPEYGMERAIMALIIMDL